MWSVIIRCCSDLSVVYKLQIPTAEKNSVNIFIVLLTGGGGVRGGAVC
jgi:hypothetical protein